MSDLFGADLPVEGGEGGHFAWRDGPFLRALKAGHWILLDEVFFFLVVFYIFNIYNYYEPNVSILISLEVDLFKFEFNYFRKLFPLIMN